MLRQNLHSALVLSLFFAVACAEEPEPSTPDQIEEVPPPEPAVPPEPPEEPVEEPPSDGKTLNEAKMQELAEQFYGVRPIPYNIQFNRAGAMHEGGHDIACLESKGFISKKSYQDRNRTKEGYFATAKLSALQVKRVPLMLAEYAVEYKAGERQLGELLGTEERDLMGLKVYSAKFKLISTLNEFASCVNKTKLPLPEDTIIKYTSDHGQWKVEQGW